MTDNEEFRRTWRIKWLSSVQEFADAESQRRLWLDPANTNLHSTFVEYLCCYFDDLGLSVGGYDWAVNKKLVTAPEVAAVSRFHQLAGSYESPTEDYDHGPILEDAKWAEVVEAAKRPQADLFALLDHPHERQFLMEL